MDKDRFYDEISLAEVAEKIGKKAVELGLLQELTVRIFSDKRQFYVPSQKGAEPLTPEEAYFQFKALVEQGSH